MNRFNILAIVAWALLIGVCASMLYGCGGGGDDEEAPAPQPAPVKVLPPPVPAQCFNTVPVPEYCPPLVAK